MPLGDLLLQRIGTVKKKNHMHRNEFPEEALFIIFYDLFFLTSVLSGMYLPSSKCCLSFTTGPNATSYMKLSLIFQTEGIFLFSKSLEDLGPEQDLVGLS